MILRLEGNPAEEEFCIYSRSGQGAVCCAHKNEASASAHRTVCRRKGEIFAELSRVTFPVGSKIPPGYFL